MKASTIFGAIVIAGLATASIAQDGPTREQKARQGLMGVLGMNLGVLGAMAKGEMPYDAAKAEAAAASIVGVAMVDQSMLWPEGSDNASSMTTRALPAIWEKPDEFSKDWTDLGVAADNMQIAASESAQAIGAAMGEMGGACSACHKAFRAPNN